MKDRLPEPGEHCLVFMIDNETGEAGVSLEAYGFANDNLPDDKRRMAFYREYINKNLVVTHWMPLPEPPENE